MQKREQLFLSGALWELFTEQSFEVGCINCKKEFEYKRDGKQGWSFFIVFSRLTIYDTLDLQ